MAKVIPVGPIDPVLYGFAKKQAEKAERDPRYVPKKLETPGHSITYRRVGATVKAFVIDKIAPVWTGKDQTYALPVVQSMAQENIPQAVVEYKQSNIFQFAIPYFHSVHGFNGYESRRTTYGVLGESTNSNFVDYVYVAQDENYEVVDNNVEVMFGPDNSIDPLNPHDLRPTGVMNILNSPQPYEYDGNHMPVYDYKVEHKYEATEDVGEHVVIDEAKNEISRSLLTFPNGLLPSIRKVLDRKFYPASETATQITATHVYNYAESTELAIDKNIMYSRFNALNFDAKTSDEILPPELVELAYRSETLTYNFSPADVWFSYFNIDGRPRRTSSYPASTTSSSSVVSNAGKATKFSAAATDCIGEFYHVEISASTAGMVAAPPWEIEEVTVEENPYADTLLRPHGPQIPPQRTITLYKNGDSVVSFNVEAPESVLPNHPRYYDYINSNSYGEIGTGIGNFVVDVTAYRLRLSPIDVRLHASMEPTGGVAIVFCITNWHSAIEGDFGIDALDCASVFVKSGVFALGYDYQAQGEKHCVVFIPNPAPEELHPVIHLSKVGEPKNYYILKPHKKYDPEKETELNRFTRASLFVSAKNPNPTEKGRRCYISFDDGVCMDLTDFADALAADPDISAEDWDGKPFRYSPMEPIDVDAPDYDYYDFKPRRIKRAYAPQWVRAYYDYEDQP